jgi:hypothetical protein
MKSVSILTAVAFVSLCACAFAGMGNDMPSGQHYNLNIIGVTNGHDVGDSQGHTLFVLLSGKTRIYMTQDPDGEFKVVDRDGTDGTAEFNIAPGHYDVYARALGRPGGGVHIESWGEFEDDTGTPVLKLGEIDISREKGKPQTVSLNRLFYVDVTLVVNGQTVEYKNTWVFDIQELLDYYWEYYNNNLKLLQVRFYLSD